MVSQIEETFAKKEYAIATFIDIAGAFDNITFDAVNSHIEKSDINIQIAKWIKFMLKSRTILVETNGHLTKVRATRGTPQGGVLSPTLSILVMNSLLEILHNNGHIAVGYDLTIVCRGKHLSTLSERTQYALKMVHRSRTFSTS